MKVPTPTTVCQCGYRLFQFQSCPECGRTYKEAIARRPTRPKWIALIIVAILLALSPFVLMEVATRGYSNERVLIVAGQVMGMWLGLLVLIGCGLVSGMVLWFRPNSTSPHILLISVTVLGLIWWGIMMIWGLLHAT